MIHFSISLQINIYGDRLLLTFQPSFGAPIIIFQVVGKYTIPISAVSNTVAVGFSRPYANT